MRIGFDIDDVLADCLPCFLAFYNQRHSTNFQPEELTAYSYWSGESKEEWLEMVNDYYKSAFFQNIKPIPGSVEAVQLFKEHGHTLEVITARPEAIEAQTAQWLTKYYGDAFRSINFAGRLLGTDSIGKEDHCRNLKIDILIEDAPTHVEKCLEAGAKILLLDQPWNQDFKLPTNVTRVFNWLEITNVIEK